MLGNLLRVTNIALYIWKSYYFIKMRISFRWIHVSVLVFSMEHQSNHLLSLSKQSAPCGKDMQTFAMHTTQNVKPHQDRRKELPSDCIMYYRHFPKRATHLQKMVQYNCESHCNHRHQGGLPYDDWNHHSNSRGSHGMSLYQCNNTDRSSEHLCP